MEGLTEVCHPCLNPVHHTFRTETSHSSQSNATFSRRSSPQITISGHLPKIGAPPTVGGPSRGLFERRSLAIGSVRPGSLISGSQMGDGYFARRSVHRPSDGLVGSLQPGLIHVGGPSVGGSGGGGDRRSSRMNPGLPSCGSGRFDSRSEVSTPALQLVWDEEGRALVMQASEIGLYEAL